MSEVELRVRVLLTMQVALLGMVTARLRSVLVAWTSAEILIRILSDGEVSPDDLELTSEIESEVISHMPDHVVTCSAESCSLNHRIVPAVGEVCVFLRAPER
jgi:hypothetical protein